MCSEDLGGLDGNSLCDGDVHDHFTYQVVRPGGWIAPGTALDTGIAHCPFFVGEVKAGATLGIQFPGFIAVVHHLITR